MTKTSEQLELNGQDMVDLIMELCAQLEVDEQRSIYEYLIDTFIDENQEEVKDDELLENIEAILLNILGADADDSLIIVQEIYNSIDEEFFDESYKEELFKEILECLELDETQTNVLNFLKETKQEFDSGELDEANYLMSRADGIEILKEHHYDSRFTGLNESELLSINKIQRRGYVNEEKIVDIINGNDDCKAINEYNRIVEMLFTGYFTENWERIDAAILALKEHDFEIVNDSNIELIAERCKLEPTLFVGISEELQTVLEKLNLNEGVSRRMKRSRMNIRRNKFFKKTKTQLRAGAAARRKKNRTTMAKRKRYYNVNKLKLAKYRKSRYNAMKKGIHIAKIRRG